MTDTYRNPVIRGVNPDPTICRVGQDYYLATSTMALYPGVPIYHSRDLVNWRPIGHALTRPEHFQLNKLAGKGPMIFAPTLRWHDGLFYLITTNVHGGGNFLVTAADPAGPWSDPIEIDLPMFDPSLFFDDDGTVYYTRRGDSKNQDITQATIDLNTGRLTSPYRSVGRGMVSDDAEAPHLFKAHGWYYLTCAEGGSRFLHMQTIGRSKSPWGPFEPCPHNPVISQHHAWWHPVRSAGHADFIEAHDGTWWAVFLATRHASYDQFSTIGRETFLAPVEWRDGWPVVLTQATRELQVRHPILPPHAWPKPPARDDFDQPDLGFDWAMIGYPAAAFASTRARPGHLRLIGQPGDFSDGGRLAFVGRRQQDLDFEIETAVDFTPVADEEAGICLFQLDRYHYDLLLRRTPAGGREAVLRKTVGDMQTHSAAVPVTDGVVRLKVVGTAVEYRFSVATEAGAWQEVGRGLTQLLATELASTWGGLLIGMYARAHGAPEPAPADFDWFDYRPSPGPV